MKIKLGSEQVQAIKFLLPLNYGIVKYGTGTGKSLIQIVLAYLLLQQKRVEKIILFSTKNSIIEVLEEFKKYSKNNPFLIKEVEDFKRFILGDYKVGIFQYNRILDLELEVIKEILKEKKVGVCFDEFHVFKNPESKLRGKFEELRPYFLLAYGFTATPVTRNLFDLYYLVEFLDLSVFESFRNFRNLYVETFWIKKGKTRFLRIKNYRNLDHLKKILERFLIEFSPQYKVSFKKQVVSSTRLQKYDKLVESILENGKKEGRVSKLWELQEIVDRDYEKVSKFINLIKENLFRGVFVFVSSFKTLDLLKKVLNVIGVSYRVISGKVNSEERVAVKEWFKDAGGKVLISTLAGGQSLNLQHTNYVLFYNIPFGMGYFKQVMGRVVRYYSKYKEFDVDFLCLGGTIDEYKYELVSASREINATLFQDGVLPVGETFSFNEEIIKRLRKRILWRR